MPRAPSRFRPHICFCAIVVSSFRRDAPVGWGLWDLLVVVDARVERGHVAGTRKQHNNQPVANPGPGPRHWLVIRVLGSAVVKALLKSTTCQQTCSIRACSDVSYIVGLQRILGQDSARRWHCGRFFGHVSWTGDGLRRNKSQAKRRWTVTAR